MFVQCEKCGRGWNTTLQGKGCAYCVSEKRSMTKHQKYVKQLETDLKHQQGLVWVLASMIFNSCDNNPGGMNELTGTLVKKPYLKSILKLAEAEAVRQQACMKEEKK